MKFAMLCTALALPTVARAEVYPAMFDVSGVAANDVLNVRSAPDAASPIAGSLLPDQTGVEVVQVSEDGKWGLINSAEGAGWAAMKFLTPQDRPAWFALQSDLRCSGTEPFWALGIQPLESKASLSSPDARTQFMDIKTRWPGAVWHPVVGLEIEGMGVGGMAVVRSQSCSDGMSDHVYGLSLDLFLRESGGGAASTLHGCCTLVP